MAQIWKSRARVPTASGRPTAAYYGNGVGGKYLNQPCTSITIGEHNVIIPVSELIDWLKDLKKCDESISAIIFDEVVRN